MSISKDKEDEIRRLMHDIGLKEDDLVEKFILGSGRGGQNLQKTYSCVYLKHIPSGIEVKCQKDRSREVNRWHARRAICEKFQNEILLQKTKKSKKWKKYDGKKRQGLAGKKER
jgi:protein subunit release factor B